MTYMKQIIVFILTLQLISCSTTSYYPAKDEIKITDEVGRVKGYVRSNGNIIDSTGRVTGYIRSDGTIIDFTGQVTGYIE